MKKLIYLSLIIILLIGILLVMVSTLPYRILKPKTNLEFNKTQLDYANLLLSKGLLEEAGLAYQDYIDKAKLDKKELSKIYYKLGNIYLDSHQYEKALAIFYKIETLDCPIEFKEELSQKIVQALEDLGMTTQAQYELETRTSLKKKEEKKEKIIAQIGKEEISEREIKEALNGLPQWMQKEFLTPSGKKEFIRQYVGQEVLYRKAKRLGLDKNPKIRKNIAFLIKQIVVEEFLKKEIEEKLKYTEDDLKLYYQANKNDYLEKEAIKISYQEVKNNNKQEAKQALREGKGTKLNDWIFKGQSFLPEIGEAKEIIEQLFLIKKGNISSVFKIQDKAYIFSIDERKAQQQKNYEEVKNYVEKDYKLRKQTELTKSLLKKALEEQEVKFFYEPEEE